MKRKCMRAVAGILAVLFIASVCIVAFAAIPDTIAGSAITETTSATCFKGNGTDLPISRYRSNADNAPIYRLDPTKPTATTGDYTKDAALDAGLQSILLYGYPVNMPTSSEIESHFNGLTEAQMAYATQAAIYAWMGTKEDAPESVWKGYTATSTAITAASSGEATTLAYFKALFAHAVAGATRTSSITSAGGYEKDLYLELNGANYSAVGEKALPVTVSKCSEHFTYTVTPTSITVTEGTFDDSDKVMLGLSITKTAFDALTAAQKNAMQITVQANDYGTNAEIASYSIADATKSGIVRAARGAAEVITIDRPVKIVCKGTYNTPFDITKTDALNQSTPVVGATIGIYTDSACATAPIQTGVTNASGKYNVTGLVGSTPSNTYYFKEISAPAGYLINTNIYTFRITELGALETGSATSFTDAPNNATNQAFTFSKVDNTGAPVAGAYIAIYPVGNTTTPLFQASSDSAGRVSVPAGTLAVGDYTFKETYAPSGYEMDATARSLRVADNGAVTGDNNLTITNRKTENGGVGINEPFYIEKVDADNAGKYLSGALFRIYDSSSNAVKSGETGTNGRLLIEQKTLPAGTYTIYEEIAPSGYVKNSASTSITVMQTGIVRGVTDGILRITNKAGSNVPNAVTSGTVTVLERTSNQPVPGYVLTFTGPQTYALTTDASGRVSMTSATDGTYKFKTTAAPATYACNMDEYTLTKTNGSFTGTQVVYVDFIKVAYKKVDSKDKNKVLPGAKFTLYDASFNEISSATTGADGMVAFTKMRPGKYTVKETAAPAGYTPSNKVYEFEITAQSANSAALVIENGKGVQTGVENPYATIAVIAAIVLCGFGVGALLSKKGKKN